MFEKNNRNITITLHIKFIGCRHSFLKSEIKIDLIVLRISIMLTNAIFMLGLSDYILLVTYKQCVNVL